MTNKGISKKILCLLIFICFICIPLFANEKETLQKNAIETNPEYFFPDDEFIFLGIVEIDIKTFFLAYNLHIWGASRRATGRVLLFNSEYELIGDFGVINTPPEKLDGKKLVFLTERGNIIDFSEGIPEKVLIDGEIHVYTSYLYN